MTNIALVVLGLFAVLIPAIISWKSDRTTIIGFYVLIVIDALCVKFVFPYLPANISDVTLVQAFAIATISAVVVGTIGLAVLRSVVTRLLSLFAVSEKTGLAVAENVYVMFGPIINAWLLIFWTLFVPSLGFYTLWPSALLGGLILHFLDVGLMRRWTQLARGAKIKD